MPLSLSHSNAFPTELVARCEEDNRTKTDLFQILPPLPAIGLSNLFQPCFSIASIRKKVRGERRIAFETQSQ
jgi:hypothetical protein